MKPPSCPPFAWPSIEDAQRWAAGRMKRKVLGAQSALEGGVQRVVIADGRLALSRSRPRSMGKARYSRDDHTDAFDCRARGPAHVRRDASSGRSRSCAGWAAPSGMTTGRAYLDATSGQGVALIGHSHPAVARAVAEQAATLITCADSFHNDRRAALYEALTALLPPGFDRFFLCNSGTEANEAALKLARHADRAERHRRRRSAAFTGGRSARWRSTWNPKYREPFQSWLPDVTHIAPDDLDAARAAITDETAAVVFEAVQGEGGVHPLDPAYVQELRRLCDERGALLIVDEIQTGLGRTGRWFGFEHAGVTPDIVTLGKGIAGGVPMGAAAWRGALGQFEAGTHGSTFGGNPLACAAALAALRRAARRTPAGTVSGTRRRTCWTNCAPASCRRCARCAARHADRARTARPRYAGAQGSAGARRAGLARRAECAAPAAAAGADR